MLALTRRRALAGAVTIALAFVPAGSKPEEFINVLTGGTSGVYYPLGVALSQIYADKIDGARTQVQSTKASVEKIEWQEDWRVTPAGLVIV